MPQPGGSGKTRPTLLVPRSQLEEVIDRQLERGRELLEHQIQSWDELERLNRDFDSWDDYNEQLLRSRFSTEQVADEYRRLARGLGSSVNPPRAEAFLRRSFDGQMRKLESIRDTLEFYESAVGEAKVAGSEAGSPRGTKIFLVHGHDNARKLEVAQFLEQGTGERPIILHEPADKGRTIIEKFEDHASEAGFAVILLTADDVGSKKNASHLNPRARQNVVFEFGFFIAKLGRANVVALTEREVERPSDIDGVLYKSFDGNWHTELAKEIRAAGIKFEL